MRHFFGGPLKTFSVSLKNMEQSCSSFITMDLCDSLCYALFTSQCQYSSLVIFQNDFFADGMKLSSNDLLS